MLLIVGRVRRFVIREIKRQIIGGIRITNFRHLCLQTIVITLVQLSLNYTLLIQITNREKES